MLDDAKKMVNNPHMEPIVSSDGATPLHVAAAKNYTTVLKYVLIKGNYINQLLVIVGVHVHMYGRAKGHLNRVWL